MPYVKQQPVASAGSPPITLHGFALGRELRTIIVNAGFTQAQLAKKLGLSEPRLSRMITGRYPVTTENTAAILAVCGITGQRRETLLDLTRAQSITVLDATQLRSLMRRLQVGAGVLVDCCPLLLPPMVWTRDYADEVLTRTVAPTDVQMDEQIAEPDGTGSAKRIHPGRAPTAEHYELLVSEAALRLPVGRPHVMATQLRELSTWCTRPRAQVRVVPVAAGAHGGLRGSFSLVHRPELTVVTADDAVRVRFYDHPDDVALYQQVVDGLRALALTPNDSRQLIDAIATELSGNDTPDDTDNASDGSGES